MFAAVEPGRTVKVGELLVEADLLTSGDVIEATQVSKRLGIPIGRVLLVSGSLTEEALQAALQAQVLLRDEAVNHETAVEALRQTAFGVKFQEALANLNCKELMLQQDIVEDVSGLLLDSNIVTNEQLQLALNTSSSDGVPLGAALVLQGVLSASFFPTFTRTFERLRSRHITREQATDELKSAFLMWLKAEDSFRQKGQTTNAAADLLASEELPAELSALEPASRPAPVPRLVDLLKDAGAVNQYRIQRKYEEVLEDPDETASLFVSLGIIDKETAAFSRRCHALLQRRLLSREQAVKSIRKCATGVAPTNALSEETKQHHQFFNPHWRKKTVTRAVGSTVLGALLGGIILGIAQKKR